MAKKIMVAGSKYTNKEGQEKTQWHEVGIIMTTQAGKEYVLLNPYVNLAGFPREASKDRLIASIFEDKPKDEYQQAPSQYATPTVPGTQIPLSIEESNIPF